MLTEAILISVWAAICTLDLFSFQAGLWRPIFSGTITGLILGDFTQGLIIGSTLELMWLGVVGVGAYVPPDVISGAILGTAIGIISGQGALAGIAIAIPVAVIVQQLDVIARTLTIGLTHKADRLCETGEFKDIDFLHLSGLPIFLMSRALPVFLAIYFGASHVEQFFTYIPKFILDGLKVAGNLLPALGFGLLLSLMLNKNVWVYLLLGIVCSVYLKIPTIGLALIGIVVAIVIDSVTSTQKNNTQEKVSIEEEYDL
ncbi:MAG: PTS mannose/fructose/sorbose/N-acetylgalactosamine transporter subunit IIC [Cetobacterium sp.]